MSQAIPTPPAGSIDVHSGGRSFAFEFPDSDDARNLLGQILAGREYPVFQLPDYTPAVVVDVGANVGASALLFHATFPAARVLCYEPSPTNFSYLQRNLKDRGPFELYPYGLSDRRESVRLYVGRRQYLQCSVIANADTLDAFEPAELRRASEEFTSRGIGEVGVLKIDTEGCELPILADLRPWLARTDLLYIEYHSEDDRRAIDALLAEHFVLGVAKAAGINRGMNLYVSRRILQRYPDLDKAKIVRA